MKTYLVPTDFSKTANHAMDFAIQLAEKTGAAIQLLHVLEIPHGSYSLIGEITDDYKADHLYEAMLIRSSKSKLEELVASISAKGISATSLLRYGHPYKHIQHEITAQNADLVIMGSDGASGLEEILLGSNTERVIRNAKCPVVTIKGETDLASIKDIVYATDVSPDQHAIVKYIRDVQKGLNCQLHLLRVCTSKNFLPKGKAMEQLKEFAEKYGFHNFTFNVIEAEFAGEGILDFAKKNNMGLIVMGTKGRVGIAHLVGGSTAEAVANHSPIPVLTLRLPS